MSIEDSIKAFDNSNKNSKVVEMPNANGLEMIKDGHGNIKANSIVNAMYIINHDTNLSGLLAYNAFSYEIEVMKDIPELNIEAGVLQDRYTPAIQAYIEGTWQVLFNSKNMEAAITNVASNNQFNPVQDFLNDCYENWDGTERAADFLPVYLGTEKTEITELITKVFFVGAVGKAFEPSMKFDYVLDLVGGQGAGKTTLIQKMAGQWYTDNFTSFDNKDDYSNMLRALIINDDEMTATNKSDFETLKKFVSSKELEFRAAYTKGAVRRPKGFVMARTTNERTYLKDKTGERRFLPILVDPSQQIKHPFSELSEDTVNQLWGEFVSYYKAGFDFKLSLEQTKELNEYRSEFMYIDDQEEAITDLLAKWSRDFITSSEIAFEIVGESNLVANRKLSKKIKYVMGNLDGWAYKVKRINGEPKRGYQRIK